MANNNGSLKSSSESFIPRLGGVLDEILLKFPEAKGDEKWRFFLEIAKIIRNQRESELSRLEFAHPQKIFHAPSAMAEVEIAD